MKREQQRKKDVKGRRTFNVIAPMDYPKLQVRDDDWGYLFEEGRDSIIKNLEAQIEFWKNMTEKDYFRY